MWGSAVGGAVRRDIVALARVARVGSAVHTPQCGRCNCGHWRRWTLRLMLRRSVDGPLGDIARGLLLR
eukprot:1955393-Alexandrium_andersonii.AAC.1